MATVEEVKITGRKYRIWDAVNGIWKRISYWTKASDVEFEDGLNLEDKISDMNTEITQDITVVNQSINNLNSTKIAKSQLTFVLSGSDLYITKTY